MNRKEILENATLAIENGKIVFIGKNPPANISAETKINVKGKVALPGLINCHTHVPMTLFRGMAEDRPLDDWLKRTIWPLEAKLRPEHVYAGALLGCLEIIKGGTTCLADMYFHEDKVAAAVEKSGLRGVLAEGIIEGNDERRGMRLFQKSVDFVRDFNGHADGRISVMLAPHSAYACGSELLSRISKEASELKVGVHIHLSESDAMFRKLGEKHGISEVQFLDSMGFFNNHVLAAHCICLSEMDMQVLSKHGVNVAYVPVSNMKLGLDIAKAKSLLDLNVNVGFGTDGPASNNSLDMFETMKTGALLQKLLYEDPAVLPAFETLQMATLNGAKALGIDKHVGSLEAGKRADLILVDFSKPHLKPLHDVYASLVYSAHAGDVDTVIVNGQILMENRHVTMLDEEAIMEDADKAFSSLI
jgi:5-methylthioadenosine/S-adenosylhomocysteine deaminase